MGVIAIWNRLRYYRRSFGTRQTAKLYGARGIRRSTMEFRVPGVPHAISCRPTEPDRFTICHVFIERECDVPIPLAPRLIVDAGANVGYVSVYYGNQFPEADIVALEADLGNFAAAERNCAPYPRVELLHAGLWPRDTALVPARREARATSSTSSSEPGSVRASVCQVSSPGRPSASRTRPRT